MPTDAAPYDLVVLGDLVLPDMVLPGGYVAVRGEAVAAVGQGAPPPAASVADHSGMLVLPGLVDGHMHTSSSLGWAGIEGATMSAAAGGVTTCVDMPYDVPRPVTDADILREKPDGVFLSNGPGDPAATGRYAVSAIQGVLDAKVPVFGICLGHQLLGTALGGRIEKLAFGHHGGNHPVRRLSDGTVEITSQNHNFALVEGSIFGAEVTHVNLNDGVIEGIRSTEVPAFGVQHHPEAGPGPHDSAYLFAEFAALMKQGS